MYPKTDEVKVIRTGPGVPSHLKGRSGTITHKNAKRIVVTFANGDYWFFAPTDLRIKKDKPSTQRKVKRTLVLEKIKGREGGPPI